MPFPLLHTPPGPWLCRPSFLPSTCFSSSVFFPSRIDTSPHPCPIEPSSPRAS
ncbi:MAG: hypothetical protein BYD32DRAFT_408676 [Podila humilis]|nr:MAG: hypothetical protein BYD32DRAFT_408676 [Podila humilis]